MPDYVSKARTTKKSPHYKKADSAALAPKTQLETNMSQWESLGACANEQHSFGAQATPRAPIKCSVCGVVIPLDTQTADALKINADTLINERVIASAKSTFKEVNKLEANDQRVWQEMMDRLYNQVEGYRDEGQSGPDFAKTMGLQAGETLTALGDLKKWKAMPAMAPVMEKAAEASRSANAALNAKILASLKRV